MQRLSGRLRSVLALTCLVDYDSAFVVAVFQGFQYGTGTMYGVEVWRIVERDGTLVVYARFREPAYGVPVGAMPSSPYAAVEVEKPAGLDSNVEAVLKITTVKTRS